MMIKREGNMPSRFMFSVQVYIIVTNDESHSR